MKNKKYYDPWLAVALSVCVPGTGIYFVGHKVIGLTTLLVVSFLVGTGLYHIISYSGNTQLGLLLLFIGVVLYLLTLIITYFFAKKISNKEGNLSFQDTRSMKNPFLAILMTLILPGSGFLYMGDILNGLVIGLIYILMLIYGFNTIVWVIYFLFSILTAVLLIARYKKEFSQKISLQIIIKFLVGLYTFIFLLLLIHFFIRGNYVSWTTIQSESMEPTLKKMDFLLIDKTFPFGIPRGSIVIFDVNDNNNLKSVAKRIVAYPNEEIEIKYGSIFINGKQLTLPPFDKIRYITDSTCGYAREGMSFKVPEKMFFALGDNSQNSYDSRHFGPVRSGLIKGVDYKIIWPINHISSIFQWECVDEPVE